MHSADDRLGQSIVDRVPDRPDRGDRTGVKQPGGVADRDVVRPGLEVVHDFVDALTGPLADSQCHLQSLATGPSSANAHPGLSAHLECALRYSRMPSTCTSNGRNPLTASWVQPGVVHAF
ncbi:MAG: hypothetical protein QOD35_3108 [Nocardioidaceae bacterium]|nr:hypothetical protein [Nocardioidaceae bacterium]